MCVPDAREQGAIDNWRWEGASGASSASLLGIVVATVTASQSTSVAPQAHQGGSRGVYLRTCHQVSVTVRTVRTASVARSQAQ